MKKSICMFAMCLLFMVGATQAQSNNSAQNKGQQTSQQAKEKAKEVKD